MEKQLQLPSAAQPAGTFCFFFQVFSSSVYWLGEGCCLCLPDSCMLHVPVELSHIHIHTHTHTHTHTLETSPLCSGVCISGSISLPFRSHTALLMWSESTWIYYPLPVFTPYCLLIRPLRSQVAFVPRADWQTSFLPPAVGQISDSGLIVVGHVRSQLAPGLQNLSVSRRASVAALCRVILLNRPQRRFKDAADGIVIVFRPKTTKSWFAC